MIPTKENRVLVTGGAGFIGSHLVKRLVSLGFAVTVVDNLSRGSLQNLQEVKHKITFFTKDLTKESGLVTIFEGHSLVFNLAALNTGIDYDAGRTQRMFEENMLLQMIPLRVAAKTLSVKKFIQISTASVYSRNAMEHQVPTPETADTTNPEPSKIGYALAKKMGENLAQWYAQTTKIHTVTARFINVYGELDNIDDKGHFIPSVIKKFVLAKKSVTIFGRGNQKRSFLYVRDAVNGLLTLSTKGKRGNVYNIDAGEEHSVRDVVICIQKQLNKQSVAVIYDKTKPEGSKRRLLDATKIRALGWRPHVSFNEGLKRTIADISSRIP